MKNLEETKNQIDVYFQDFIYKIETIEIDQDMPEKEIRMINLHLLSCTARIISNTMQDMCEYACKDMNQSIQLVDAFLSDLRNGVISDIKELLEQEREI